MLGSLRSRLLGVAIAVVLVVAGGVAALRLADVGVGAPEAPPPVALIVSPADGAVEVRLDAAVEVSATLGRLDGVAVTAAGVAATPASRTEPGPDPATGPTELPGAGDGRRWKSAMPLQPGVTYTVASTVTNQAGRSEVRRSTFTTLTPSELLKVPISPLDGQTVGIGMPLALYPSVAVTDHDEFESRLQVTTTPEVAGAWHWFSDTEVHYRPENYWAPGTKVAIEARLGGFDNGDGAWAVTPRAMSFTIGDAHISTVDAGSHQMTVTSGGATLQTFAVSTGRDEYPTASGIHVVSEKLPSVIMDSSTVGIPRGSAGGYYQTVKLNVRISDSGEFVHSAPWSVDDQGQNNVSHGCVNMAPDDARWFFDFSVPGDIVTVTGTPTQLEPTNGFGDWNVAWSDWDN